MRRSPTLIISLGAACFALFGSALVQGSTLPPLPIVRTVSLEALTAKPTELSDLERAGFTFHDTGADAGKAGKRELSYVFEGPSGFSAVLRDDGYAPDVLISRELTFDIRVAVRQGNSPADMPGFTPGLVAAAQHAARYDEAVVAGLGYLATEAGPGISPAVLQDAVIDYLQRYRQPWTPIQEACAGCGSRNGFGDEYPGGPDRRTVLLRSGSSAWEIAAIRHYLDGDSSLTVQITARLPKPRMQP
ncbi:MAG TPA: hypothetical protein VMQ61_09915 [Thermoanaerobaculia bacterium]|nr:hypothetical protein [Thermoanaerobaculia bacterium]